MQIKRSLDDREVLVGDRVFGAQGRSYGFLVHSGGELVVAAALPVLSLKRWVAMWFTPTGLIEDWLRNDFVIIGRFRGIRRVPVAKTDLGYWCGYYQENYTRLPYKLVINILIKSLFDSCLFRQHFLIKSSSFTPSHSPAPSSTRAQQHLAPP